MMDKFIVKETRKKAFLLEKKGVTFWVKKAWFREKEGTLTPAGVKSFEKAQHDAERKEALNPFKLWLKSRPSHLHDGEVSGYGRIYFEDTYAHIFFGPSPASRYEFVAYIRDHDLSEDNFEKAYLALKRYFPDFDSQIIDCRISGKGFAYDCAYHHELLKKEEIGFFNKK